MDPLSLLREYTIGKRPITLDGNHVVFGATRYARNAPTAYRTTVSTIRGGFYTVDALWFLLQNAEAKHSDYIKHCTAQDFVAVSLPDKKPVLAYLRGQVESSTAVDYATAVVVQACGESTIPLPMLLRWRGLDSSGGARA